MYNYTSKDLLVARKYLLELSKYYFDVVIFFSVTTCIAIERHSEKYRREENHAFYSRRCPCGASTMSRTRKKEILKNLRDDSHDSARGVRCAREWTSSFHSSLFGDSNSHPPTKASIF